MTETPDRTESIFATALALPSAGERAAYLDQACAGDAALRDHVEALLRAHERAGHLLDRPAVDLELTSAHIATPEVGTVIAGRYKLLEEIGEGGMGTVWVAEQSQPVRRKVALKLIKAGMDSKSVLARFEAERQALAVMDHPNIAKVLDGGLTETGRPYFIMEYIKGVAITEYCDATRMSVSERLNLFVQICSAVQHAHQKGIIHRDLKPSNILVAPYDDKPVPKVIDFGLAKAMHQSLTERTLHTAHETVLGTPLYMSPEQAQLNNLDVDTRSDIYSLGVLLYELLTGTTPLEKKRFKEAAWDEIKRIIREEEAPRPSTRLSSSNTLASLAAGRQIEPARLTKLVRGELDWIVMKALEKDRTRRYDTANGFAMDVQRYLSGEAVMAVPPSARYRVKKFVKRNKGQVVTASLLVGALVAGIAGTTWGLIQARQQEKIARDETTQKEQARAAEAERAEGERLAKQRAEAGEKLAAQREREEKQAREQAQEVSRFMQEVFTQGSGYQLAAQGRTWRSNLTVKDAMDFAARTIEGKFNDKPEIEAALRFCIGRTYWELGSLPEAERNLKASSILWEKTRGPDYVEALRCAFVLAELYVHKEDFDSAEPLFKRVSAARETVLGGNHIDTLQCQLWIAFIHYRQGDYAAAESEFLRLLAISAKAIGPDAVITLDLKHSLARLALSKREFSKAEALFKESLAARERVFGETSFDTLESVRDLGEFYLRVRDFEQAEFYIKRALRDYKRSLGPDAAAVRACVFELGQIYLDKGDHLSAEPLLKQALAGQEKDLGTDHPETVRSRLSLAILYLRMKDFDRSEPLLRQCLTIRQKIEPDAWTTFNTQSMLGGALLGQKKYADAEPLLLAGYEGMKQREKTIPPAGQARIPEAIERLVQLYEAVDKKDDAAKWRKEVEAAKVAGKKVEKKP